MINLMYIVLTAMLALNVSSDVLDGFTQVHDGLNRSNNNVAQRNEALYSQLAAFAEQNPDKGLQWFEKAREVRDVTGQIYSRVDSLKYAIVRKADGSEGDPDNIINRDDLEAAAVVMLAPGNSLGSKLRHNIDFYREYINQIMVDSVKRASIAGALSTDDTLKPGIAGTLKQLHRMGITTYCHIQHRGLSDERAADRLGRGLRQE